MKEETEERMVTTLLHTSGSYTPDEVFVMLRGAHEKADVFLRLSGIQYPHIRFVTETYWNPFFYKDEARYQKSTGIAAELWEVWRPADIEHRFAHHEIRSVIYVDNGH